MLNIENVNHIGIRIKDKSRSVAFYKLLGFEFSTCRLKQSGPYGTNLMRKKLITTENTEDTEIEKVFLRYHTPCPLCPPWLT